MDHEKSDIIKKPVDLFLTGKPELSKTKKALISINIRAFIYLVGIILRSRRNEHFPVELPIRHTL